MEKPEELMVTSAEIVKPEELLGGPELFLLTKLDMCGDQMEPSLRFQAPAEDEALLPILGEITGFAPDKRDGTPNPGFIPFRPESGMEQTRVKFDWDAAYNIYLSDGEQLTRCGAQYYREDIDAYYYQLENLSRLRLDPEQRLERSKSYNLFLGSEEGCVDVD